MILVYLIRITPVSDNVLCFQIDLVCADRGFAYQRTEELENPEIHRLLVGFGRTSDRNGPGVPLPAHQLIQEVDVQMRVEQPLLSLPYQIFGSAPPVQSFDFAKMLTVSLSLPPSCTKSPLAD